MKVGQIRIISIFNDNSITILWRFCLRKNRKSHGDREKGNYPAYHLLQKFNGRDIILIFSAKCIETTAQISVAAVFRRG